MEPTKPKSIDGIVPKRRQPHVYVAKRRLDALRPGTPLVSIQPRESNEVDRRRNVNAVRSTNGQSIPTPACNPHYAPQPLSQRTGLSLSSKEVVVRLPRNWSLRASLSLVIQYIITAAIAVAAAYSTSIGQWFVLALAIYVFVRRQDPQLTFGIALFILVSVPFFQAIGQSGVANNMAIYVYELLVLGTIQALIELKWPKKVDSH